MPTTSCRTTTKVAYVQSSPNWQPGEHHPLRWRADIHADIRWHTTTRGHLRIVADSVAQSTRRRHWPVTNVTAPSPTRCLTCRCLYCLPTSCRDSSVYPSLWACAWYRWQLVVDNEDKPEPTSLRPLRCLITLHIFSLLVNKFLVVYSHLPGHFLSLNPPLPCLYCVYFVIIIILPI